jgi:hypothetical protein
MDTNRIQIQFDGKFFSIINVPNSYSLKIIKFLKNIRPDCEINREQHLGDVQLDYNDLDSIRYLLNEFYTSINNNDEQIIDQSILYIYSPYSLITINHYYDSTVGTTIYGNSCTYSIKGFTRESFFKYCALISHTGYMNEPGILHLDEHAEMDNEILIPAPPRPMKRQNGHVNTTLNILIPEHLTHLLTMINPNEFTSEEINHFVNVFFTWDRIKILLLIASRAEQKNVVSCIPKDILRYISEFL